MSMMRLADDKALADLLKGTHLKVSTRSNYKGQTQSVKPQPAPQPERSALETSLQAQLEATTLPPAEYDVPYLIGTRHRLDVCWRDIKFGVEVQGMAHRIKGKFKTDIVKRATGLLQGWTILEVDNEAIANGKAIEWIKILLKDRHA